MRYAVTTVGLGVISAFLLVAAWGVRLHDTRELNRLSCQRVEHTNTALRLMVTAAVRDPKTPEPIKAEFRTVLRDYLKPQSC